jgi:hypothetical protein
VNERRRRARNGRRGAALRGGATDRLAGTIHVHLALDSGRRGLARIHHHLAAIGSAVQQPQAAAAKPRRIRLDHCQHTRDGDRGVECIAAALENLVAGRSGKRMRRRDRRISFLRRGAGKR